MIFEIFQYLMEGLKKVSYGVYVVRFLRIKDLAAKTCGCMLPSQF
jgi:hypothetical protein